VAGVAEGVEAAVYWKLSSSILVISNVPLYSASLNPVTVTEAPVSKL
jgi:hypothetical protein